MNTYTRPELTKEEKAEVHKAAQDAVQNSVRRHGIVGMTNHMTIVLAAVLEENTRLAKEVNEHRAAREIEPLPTFKVQ